MKIFFIFIIFTLYLNAQTILIMNSNTSIKKYSQTQKAFMDTIKCNVKSIDVSKMTQSEIKNYLYDEYPDIVYTIGSRAYQYAYKYIPEKKIFFSNIVNWNRLPKKKHFAGVLVELHSGTKLTLMNSLGIRPKKIAVFYSKYTKSIISSLKENAKLMGIEIIGKKVDSINELDIESVLQISNAVLIIPDPVVLKDKDEVEDIFELAKKYKIPVVAYDKLFVDYGAVLSISVDNPTIGRQVAVMIEKHLNKQDMQNIQYPAGTHVVFSKRISNELGIEVNESKLKILDELIK